MNTGKVVIPVVGKVVLICQRRLRTSVVKTGSDEFKVTNGPGDGPEHDISVWTKNSYNCLILSQRNR